MTSPPPISRLFAGTFPALERELVSRLCDPAWGGPGWGRILLVPSNDLREHLMKRLASARERAAAGASMMTLYDFALKILRHRGISPVELSPVRMASAVLGATMDVYAGGDGDFARIARAPGFSVALMKTLADLEEGWIGDAELSLAEKEARSRGDARGAARWAEWRRLTAAFERKVRAMGGETRRKIFQDAVKYFEQPGYSFRVSMYGFYDFTRLQWTLVDRILSSGLLDEAYFPGVFDHEGNLSPSFFYAAKTWDRLKTAFESNVEFLEDEPAPPVAGIRARIFSSRSPAVPETAPFTVLSAPNEQGEMRFAARRVRRWLDEAPRDSVFLVARKVTPEVMADWERVAEEYGIQTAGRINIPLVSVPPARLLLRMMEAARDDYPRSAVIDILSSPYRRMVTDGGPVPPRPDLWDILSRQRMIVFGNDWETRLSKPSRRKAEKGEEGQDGAEAQRELLLTEFRSLRNTLSPLLKVSGYASFARAAREALTKECQIILDGGRESERDRRAVEELFGMLSDMEGISETLVAWTGIREAIDWFAALLASRRLFVGKRGGMRAPKTVVFGDSISMRGVTADRALVLSVNEEEFPARMEEDPLLPDEERMELNRIFSRHDLPDALSLRRRNASEEKLLFSLPAASVRKEVAFSARRADSAGAACRPSRYLLHLMSRFAGPSVFSEDWDAVAGVNVERLARSSFDALSGAGPLSRRETALAAWRTGEVSAAPDVYWRRILRTLHAWNARAKGDCVYPGGVAVSVPAAHSASSLDTLARCPYRYLLGVLLRFEPPPEPEETISLAFAELGEIAHEILRILGKEAAKGKGWGDVDAAAKKAITRFARENPTGLPGLFRIQCMAVAEDVNRLVELERLAWSEHPGWRVERLEERFTLPPSDLPGFRGRVDRLDRGPAGEARVIDYKYSDPKNAEVRPDEIIHGLSNQIPIYLSWAATLDPKPSSVSALFYFMRGGIADKQAPSWNEIGREWANALADWISMAKSGTFPPTPHHLFTYAGKVASRYCNSCPFKDHCRVSPAYDGSEAEDALSAAILRDPVLEPLSVHRPEKG
ncbi:MAG: PD-(D/E)XK nuclease family protein [Syntrophorhabdaceae bacterium]|nr:PD-(D/E)XK nuclease family protein [Syntrophorhabdaceae bacterium]